MGDVPEEVVRRGSEALAAHWKFGAMSPSDWSVLHEDATTVLAALSTADLVSLLLARDGVEEVRSPMWTVCGNYGTKKVADHSTGDRLLVVSACG